MYPANLLKTQYLRCGCTFLVVWSNMRGRYNQALVRSFYLAVPRFLLILTQEEGTASSRGSSYVLIWGGVGFTYHMVT
jgi:hypothetical protein